MARIDIVQPHGGSHRGVLAADLAAMTGNPVAVGINSSGLVVVGAGQTGIVGVIHSPSAKLAGDVIDVVKHAEYREISGLAAGTVITANTTTGVLSAGAASATQTPIGYTVEATRLIVSKASPTFDAT